LLKAEETPRRIFGNDHEITKNIVSNLIDLYQVWNKSEEAEKWQAKLPQTEALDE
jgi:hypothetical protein